MRFPIWVCALLLVACGGGEPEDVESAPLAAMAAPAVKVALFGDSLEHGFNTNGVNNARIAQRRYLRRGVDVEVWEEAVGGTTAVQLLTGSDGLHALAFRRTIAASPAHIVGFRFIDARDYPPETFHAALDDLTHLAEAAGKVVILQTPSPVDKSEAFNEAARVNVQVIRQVAAAHPRAVLCDHWKVGQEVGYETSDGLHPTAEDYRVRQSRTLMRCIAKARAMLP